MSCCPHPPDMHTVLNIGVSVCVKCACGIEKMTRKQKMNVSVDLYFKSLSAIVTHCGGDIEKDAVLDTLVSENTKWVGLLALLAGLTEEEAEALCWGRGVGIEMSDKTREKMR